MKHHNHLYLKGNEVVVINRDGSPSHGSDLSKMPSYVRDMQKKKNLLEGHLVETATENPAAMSVPLSLVEKAHKLVESAQRVRWLMSLFGRR